MEQRDELNIIINFLLIKFNFKLNQINIFWRKKNDKNKKVNETRSVNLIKTKKKWKIKVTQQINIYTTVIN